MTAVMRSSSPASISDLLAVAGMPGKADVLHVGFLEGFEIIEDHGSGPGPAGQEGEVVFGIKRGQGVGIVLAVAAGVNGAQVLSPQCLLGPRPGPGRAHEHWERSGAIGDKQFHAHCSLAFGAEFQADAANPVSGAGRFIDLHGAVELWVRRKRTQGILLEQLVDFLLAGLPLVGGAHGPAVEEAQGIGQVIHAGQGVEVGRQFAACHKPLLKGRGIGQGFQELVEIIAALVGGHRPKRMDRRQQKQHCAKAF